MSRFVYVVTAEVGPVKIGLSSKPWQRLRELQTSTPQSLAFAFVAEVDAPIAPSVEERAHALALDHHVSGEWFDLSPRPSRMGDPARGRRVVRRGT